MVAAWTRRCSGTACSTASRWWSRARASSARRCASGRARWARRSPSAAVDPAGEEQPFEGDADVLVFDGSEAGDVRAALDGAWLSIRPVATAAMIEHGGGRIVLLAPPPGGAVAAGVRAGLENLARTLSVEWARFAVRPVAILPGSATSSAEVAELAAFLASPAGEYYSGCAFELGAARDHRGPDPLVRQAGTGSRVSWRAGAAARVWRGSSSAIAAPAASTAAPTQIALFMPSV